MQYQTFCDHPPATFEVAILAPKLAYAGMSNEYLEPGLMKPDEVIAYGLHQTGRKTSAADMKAYLDDLLLVLEDLQVTYLLVTDSEYFKILAGVSKADIYLGYVLPNAYPVSMRGQFQVLYVPNYRQVLYDPQKTRTRISQALNALWSHRHGSYSVPGSSIIHSATYPSTVADIASWLDHLIQIDMPLTCDIEGFSLKHYSSGIGSIGFAWSKHEGIAFPVDLSENPVAVRQLLINFFENFKNKLIFHAIGYDVTVLIYQLFMKDLLDTEGLLHGLEVFLDRPWDCTKLITYLATNSCAGNELGLKVQAQEFAGNYAVEEIKDITKIPLPKLLEYNLVDCLSTWYVYEKHWSTLVADQQAQIYREMFQPSTVDIIQIQLTGMPVNMERVKEVKQVLETDRAVIVQKIQAHPMVLEFTNRLKERHVETRNAELKVKRITLADDEVGLIEFNPNSPNQKQELLYEMIGLPVIERTKTKQPATGQDVLEKLFGYTEEQDVLDLLRAFMDFSAVDKLYTTFIPALEGSQQGPDGHHYLFGNFNLGGTVSGRLSSSDPNLQTIPAAGGNPKALKTIYSKLIKSCFQAPLGWLFCGLDFNALEDRISALTTKDSNKLKVYTDGFDGHSLRAYGYFADQMPTIETAPSGAACYKARVGNDVVYFHSEEKILYLGKEITGHELYAVLGSQGSAA